MYYCEKNTELTKKQNLNRRFYKPAGSMKALIPKMLLTVCAEGQALDKLTCPAVTGTPGGFPVGDIVLGYEYG